MGVNDSFNKTYFAPSSLSELLDAAGTIAFSAYDASNLSTEYLRTNLGVLNTAQTPSGPATPIADVQIFTSSGTWTKPAGVTLVSVFAIGGGSGGNAGTTTSGGAGGVGGAIVRSYIIRASNLNATESITVGSGGSSGSAGGQTRFATNTSRQCIAPGGASPTYAFGDIYGYSGTPVQQAPTVCLSTFSPGNGGAGVSGVNVAATPGGDSATRISTGVLGGTGGLSSGSNGGNGGNSPFYAGGGGGGGASNGPTIPSVGFTGGAGGLYGGGGGGGGAGNPTPGLGGAGGAGICIVYSW